MAALPLLVALLLAAPPAPYEQLGQQLSSGSPEERRAALSTVLAQTGSAPALLLFAASARALEEKRLDDAGFLFYAAQIRARVDQDRFPPRDRSSATDDLAAVGQQVGAAVTPALVREPAAFRKVVERLRDWDAQTVAGYEPGWPHGPAAAGTDASAYAAGVKDEYLAPAEDLATLLDDAEYAAAFRTVQDATRPGVVLRPTAAEVAAARQAAHTIEQKKGIRGPFSATGR